MEFGVLGPLLVRDGGREVQVGGMKRRALLCALLLRAGEVVPAGRLVAEVWAEPPAAATLASHIAHLRRVIGSTRVVSRAPGYALDVRPEDIDAVRFEADVSEGRAALAAGAAEQAEAALYRGLGLWRGAALVDVRDLPWAAGRAARLDELRASAVEALLEARLALGRSADVIGEAEAALTTEPLRERLWGLLMLGLYREGRQTEALDAYQRLRRVLAEELGIEPGPGVRALQAQILTHDPVLDLPARPPSAGRRSPAGGVAVPVPARLDLERLPFVGRSAELELLEGYADEVVAGSQRVVLLSGEPGVGKTRLCARLAAALAQRGWGVVYGRCEEGLAAPYRPWSEALAHLGAHVPERLVRTHVEEHGTDVVLVAPGLVTALGRDPPPRTVEGPAQQGLLLDAAVGLLAATAREQPLLCVLDDLHWGDEATLLLLRHLAQGRVRPPLLVLAVCQDAALAADHPLRACVAQLQREDGFVRLQLEGLSVAELGALAALEHGDARNLAAALHRDTGGNPFYAIELLRHGRALLDADDADPAAAADRGVPDSVRSSIGWRAARLGHDAAQVLEVAAVAGHDFTAGLLASALQVSAEHVLDALEAAEKAGLVRLVAGERFAFAHGLIRQSLYADIGPARRARWHRALAEALSALSGADAAQRARHWLAGAPGDVRAMAAAEAAGDAAMASHAYGDAVTWYAHALEELDRAGTQDARGRAELLVSLGSASRLAGYRQQAREALTAASESARRLGEPELLARAALALAGYDRMAPNLDPESYGLLREALDAVGRDHDRLRVALAARLATHLASATVVGDLAELAATAVEIAAGLGEPEARADGLCARLHTLAAPERAAERLEVSRQLAAAAIPLGDVELGLVALDHECSALAQLGHFDAARAALARYADTAGRLGIPQALAFAAHQEGFLVFAEGRVADEERVLTRLDAAIRAAWHSEFVVQASRSLLLTPLRWLQGRLSDLQAQLAPVLEFVPPTLAEPARVLLDAGGDLAAARTRLDAYLTDPGLDAFPRNALWCTPTFQLAAACAVAGTAEHAHELIRRLAPCAGLQCTYLAFTYYGAFDHHLGVLHALAGDEAAAVAHLEEALRQHRAFGARPWIAVTEHALGRLLRRRGDAHSRARGTALLASARDAGRALGMAPPARLVEPASGVSQPAS